MADALGRSDAIEHALVTRLAGIYSDALKTALRRQSAFFKKVRDVESGKIKPPQYYVDRDEVGKWREGYVRELLRQQKVIDGIIAELDKAGVKAADLIRKNMAEIWRVNREEIAGMVTREAAKRGVNVTFARYDRRQIDVLMQEQESPFSKLAYKNLGENPAIRRRLQNELAQATILGESQTKIIKRIREVTGQSYKQAKRVAQTERTRVQSQARYQAGQEAAEMGIGIYNEWRTRMINSRDAHIERNGKKVMQGEVFPGSVMRYPGDPAGGPREVINCHCYIQQRVLLPGERLDADGNVVQKEELQSGKFDDIIDWDKATFTDQKPLEWHWNKHWMDFPESMTEQAYLETARWVMKQPLKDGVLEEIRRSDGSVERYYFKENYLVGTTGDGRIRTFFRPDDKEAYWANEHPRNQF